MHQPTDVHDFDSRICLLKDPLSGNAIYCSEISAIDHLTRQLLYRVRACLCLYLLTITAQKACLVTHSANQDPLAFTNASTNPDQRNRGVGTTLSGTRDQSAERVISCSANPSARLTPITYPRRVYRLAAHRLKRLYVPHPPVPTRYLSS